MEQEDGIIVNILSAIGLLSILGLILYFAPVLLIPIILLVLASLTSNKSDYYTDNTNYVCREEIKQAITSNVKEWLLEYKLKNYGLSKKYIYASNLNEAKAIALHDPTVERILHLRQIG